MRTWMGLVIHPLKESVDIIEEQRGYHAELGIRCSYMLCITKTRQFKYIGNFTSKN